MEEIASVYARSLFEVAKEQDKLDVVREQLGQIADAISEDRELQVFFFSPYFSTEEKKDGLQKVIESVTRQPEMRDEITSIQWLGFALTEACVFYGLVAGLLAFFL